MKSYTEGIDKIDLLLNSLLIKKENIKNHKDPYNRLKLRFTGPYIILSIQDEWFYPFLDYQCQIAFAVYELVKEEIIDFPDTFLTPLFIYTYPEYFFLNIIACEFYSDFKKKNIEIESSMVASSIKEAKEMGGLYRYYDKKNNELTETYYSPDVAEHEKSLFITYLRAQKLIKDNNKMRKEEILKNNDKRRCEIKLYSSNSAWLHWDNFKGTYKNIVNRYLEYLAVICNNYILGCLLIHGKENPNFMKIMKLAEKNNKIRYKNNKGKLKKHVVWEKEKLIPDKFLSDQEIEIRKGNIEQVFSEFSVKNKNIKKAKEMAKIRLKAGKDGH